MQARKPAFRPSIYYFHPILAGPVADWPAHLDRCKAMGFSHVLIAPPFLPDPSGNLFLTSDHDRLHPSLRFSGPASAALSTMAADCRSRGMSLWLDLVLDRIAADAPLSTERPEWFARGEEDALPDPRIASATSDAAMFSYDNGQTDDILAWWRGRLTAWLESGISGFRVNCPHAVPAEFLRRVIAAAKSVAPDCSFVAWTPGLSAEEVARLEDCGFDFTVSSSAWWDYRSEWFLEEKQRLGAVAPPLHPAEPLFAGRLSERYTNSDDLVCGYRRAIDYAASSGTGWLMPMGFEVAAAAPLDPAGADPEAFARQIKSGNISFVTEITQANARAAAIEGPASDHWTVLSAPDAPVLAEISAMPANANATASLRLVNAEVDKRQTADVTALLARTGGAVHAKRGAGEAEVMLGPGEVLLLDVQRAPAVKLPAPQFKREAQAAAKSRRVEVNDISPMVEGGRFPVKRVVGQPVTVEANIFSDGHGELAADLLWRPADEEEWRRVPMAPLGNDRWRAAFRAERIGEHLFTIEAWRDQFAGMQRDLGKKQDAGQIVEVDAAELMEYVNNTASARPGRDGALKRLRARLRDARGEERIALLRTPEMREAARQAIAPEAAVRHDPAVRLTVDRGAALFSSWYELFPRSQSGSRTRHGTFADVIERLPAIRDMGFDTLYFPPIHPIGRVNRKGRNNSTQAEPGDPGSPYAIGAAEGGHDAIHPELGTIRDFRKLRDAAAEHGIELALDFAIQCAPDHPWLKEHPEWFAWRPDGTIAYAENPPKKYEDIVNVDFYAPGAIPGLWLALRDVILYWCKEGVRTFRVDNPHTKPFPFWGWMIADVRARYPDAIFLSEAFTRPQVMYQLAKAGFSQSYTYFTWRNTKWELESYLTELADGPPREFFRPHFFVNTPDINPIFLQRSGRPGFLIRAALAATLSGLWGVYSGFELCEGAALPGREEYLDSEKYEIRAWDWQRPGHIISEITALNRMRRRNPALQTHLGVRFLKAENEHILFFRKETPNRDNVILVAVNLDPFHAQEARIEVPLWEWELPDHAGFELDDLVNGGRVRWDGKFQTLRLDPNDLPYAIWRVVRPKEGGA